MTTNKIMPLPENIGDTSKLVCVRCHVNRPTCTVRAANGSKDAVCDACTTCPCGWHISDLNDSIAKNNALLAECETTSHPFRNAMLAGQRTIIANLYRHIGGHCKSTAEVN